MITSREAVWRNYIIGWKDVGCPIYAKTTPTWIKEAFELHKHKQDEKLFGLLEAHGVISSDKSA